MSQKVTIGGDRVGSGKKMQAELHDYYRSTHNLSETFASSMASGVLYPALCKLAMRGDSFDINLAADCRTIPTVGPLFGSYKLQVDVYQCPIRLYQGILHNNPLAIGLNMSQVKFPILKVWTGNRAHERNAGKFSNSCLLKYLGMSGLGQNANMQSSGSFGRIINALPALSYYDIFKTYYANKQEANAYVITPQNVEYVQPTITRVYYVDQAGIERQVTSANWQNMDEQLPESNIYEFYFEGENFEKIDEQIKIKFAALPSQGDREDTVDELSSGFKDYGFTFLVLNKNKIKLHFTGETLNTIYNGLVDEGDYALGMTWNINLDYQPERVSSRIKLQSFPLSNIDDMRYDLLGHHTLGSAFTIQPTQAGDPNEPYLPYSTLVNLDGTTGKTLNFFEMNGLVVKTYQNDIFNNWLNTEWIEGENGINELTKVAVVDGTFSMDALNMSMKLYNMLNRIALAGGTYEDWQDVVYEEVQRRQIESPIFIGGMSQEVMFDEIIQTAPTDGNPLGTLGGRGKLVGQKRGGRIHVKCDEACFIIAIVSLTPRLYYTQGNEFYMTDIFSMDDLHKPAMDGIGFQDLIAERMAWWDTVVTPSTTTIIHRSKVGKLPAWIEYMTSYDKAYGDFAGGDKSFMILSRNYEMSDNGGIRDATTYIDPSKYNYAFAVTELAAQNFWVQVHFDIKARRLMSARLIPNV